MKTKRTKTTGFSVSPAELAAIKKAAAREARKPADWMRLIVLEKARTA